jgi:trimethylamine corrinoid protein
MSEGSAERLYSAFIAGDTSAAIAVIDGVKAAGAEPAALFDSLFSPAVAMLGAAWAHRQIDEIAFAQAAVVAEQVLSFVTPASLAADKGISIVVGCAPGDRHDERKNIVAAALKEAGYRVVDIGVDSRPAEFLGRLDETGSRLVIVFAERLYPARRVGRIRELLEASGRDDVVVLVAGGPFEADENLARELGANGVVTGAGSALRLVDRVVRDRLRAEGVA